MFTKESGTTFLSYWNQKQVRQNDGSRVLPAYLQGNSGNVLWVRTRKDIPHHRNQDVSMG